MFASSPGESFMENSAAVSEHLKKSPLSPNSTVQTASLRSPSKLLHHNNSTGRTRHCSKKTLSLSAFAQHVVRLHNISVLQRGNYSAVKLDRSNGLFYSTCLTEHDKCSYLQAFISRALIAAHFILLTQSAALKHSHWPATTTYMCTYTVYTHTYHTPCFIYFLMALAWWAAMAKCSSSLQKVIYLPLLYAVWHWRCWT